jgi:hypothetical protein
VSTKLESPIDGIAKINALNFVEIILQLDVLALPPSVSGQLSGWNSLKPKAYRQ